MWTCTVSCYAIHTHSRRYIAKCVCGWGFAPKLIVKLWDTGHDELAQVATAHCSTVSNVPLDARKLNIVATIGHFQLTHYVLALPEPSSPLHQALLHWSTSSLLVLLCTYSAVPERAMLSLGTDRSPACVATTTSRTFRYRDEQERRHSNGTSAPSNTLNWTCNSPVHFLCSQTLQSLHWIVLTLHAVSHIRHGN